MVATHKLGDALCVSDKVPRLLNDSLFIIVQHHVHKHIAWEELATGHALLSIAHLNHLLHGHEPLVNKLAHLLHGNALLKAVLNLLFLTRKRLQHVPFAVHHLVFLKHPHQKVCQIRW